MYHTLLTRIKNAQRARQESFQMPFSNFDFELAKVLAENGYLAAASKKTLGKKNFLEVKIKYDDDRPAISDFRIMSKPSRRLYSGYKELKSVRQGYGIAILSTPAGVMTGKKARREKVGGEYLFEIW